MNRRFFIIGISALHLFRGLMVLLNDAAMNITAMNVLAALCGRTPGVVAAAYLSASAMALFREFWRAPKTHWSALWYAPQMGMLLLAAISALICMARGSYADREPRPFEFIAADQIIAVILAGMYLKTLHKP